MPAGADRPTRLRLFVAVPVPEELLESLAEQAAPLKERLAGGRWAPLANQHVTLKFLGWVGADVLDGLRVALRGACAGLAPAEVRIGGLGSFPSKRRVRVLWAGFEDPQRLLVRLNDVIEKAVEPLGFEREQRAFSPHLTIARFKTPQRLQEELPPLEKTALGGFVVNAARLYRSHLSPKGAQYEVLEEFELRGDE
ncbi:MAG: RNA 2',3'-cyclic phosphodiesterase [Actinomycetota bacterium]